MYGDYVNNYNKLKIIERHRFAISPVVSCTTKEILSENTSENSIRPKLSQSNNTVCNVLGRRQ